MESSRIKSSFGTNLKAEVPSLIRPNSYLSVLGFISRAIIEPVFIEQAVFILATQ